MAEASLALQSGQLEIHECAGGSIDIFLIPSSTYRVGAEYGGLGTLSEDRLDGQDRYRIVLWPASFAKIAILKQYVDPRAASMARRSASHLHSGWWITPPSWAAR